MRLKSLFVGIASAVFMQSALAGGSVDLSLNNDSVRFEYDATKIGSGLHISAGVLHHVDDGDVLSVGLNAVDVNNQKRSIFFGVGAKLFAYFTDVENSGALGVGGFFRYEDPALKGFGFGGQLYYAPRVTAISDTKSFIETDVRIQYRIVPTARLYMGYRFVEAEADAKATIEDNIVFGFRADF